MLIFRELKSSFSRMRISRGASSRHLPLWTLLQNDLAERFSRRDCFAYLIKISRITTVFVVKGILRRHRGPLCQPGIDLFACKVCKGSRQLEYDENDKVHKSYIGTLTQIGNWKIARSYRETSL